MSIRPAIVTIGATAAATSANNIVLARPSGIQVGDLLMVEASNSNQPPSDWTIPSGWTREGTPFVVNDADQRGTGLFILKVDTAGVLAALPASWTFTFPGTARILGGIQVVRYVDLAAPIGGFPAKSTTSGLARVMPSFTVARNNSLLVLAATNQVTSPNPATATVTDGTVTSVLDLATPGDTTVTRTALKVWTKPVDAGASGSQTVTWTGAATGAAVMGFALNPLPDPGFAWSIWDGTTERPATVTIWDGATEKPVTGVGYVPRNQTVSQMLASSSWIRWAHRFGSRNWVEFSARAAREAAVYWQVDALEVSVHVSASPDGGTTPGTFWCSHDAYLDRMVLGVPGGTTLPIVSLTDTQIRTYTQTAAFTDVPGQPSEPLLTLDEVDALYPGVILVIEDKTYANQVRLRAWIDAHGGAARIIWKQSGAGTRSPSSTGLIAWGYFFDTDMASFTAKQAQWDYVGLDYQSSDATITAGVTAAGASRCIHHIIPNTAQRDRMLGLGARGLMVANVRDCVPRP
ncbi:hypothetical protein [Leifsonia poae]|uniref:hypothetical protein n=1 Tax=Leifsonia poae TaxID=110933 RepID=UPI001CBF7459|nr:hypothetical protein [Leifsonia poae]